MSEHHSDPHLFFSNQQQWIKCRQAVQQPKVQMQWLQMSVGRLLTCLVINIAHNMAFSFLTAAKGERRCLHFTGLILTCCKA